MTEWQPIETAPRDGTVIIAALFASGVTGTPHFARWYKHKVGLRKGMQNWTKRNTHQPIHPTHWMPLPEPPT